MNRELLKDGKPVKLQAQHFQLLQLLVARAGQVVTREEIRQALWGDDTFVDFDRSINFCINQIRRALDDDAENPQYVETLPRKGYRFLAPVSRTDGEPTVVTAARSAVVPKSGFRNRKWLVATMMAALLAIAATAMTTVLRKTPALRIESLAVLPLENLSHDPEQDYFAAGLTDELITDLARIGDLHVISRTSAMRYKGTRKSVPQIARELNVDAVLEGTVTRDRDRVRITAQLVAAAPEKHLWAENYEADLNGILTVQDAVATAVAQEIRTRVTPQERTALNTPRAVDPAAYDAYLKGRYLWDISGERNLSKAREYFELAIRKDPGYARAWAGLADTYDRLASWGALPRREMAPLAQTAAEKALELDRDLPEAVVTLANVKADYEWDWTSAEQLYKRAIQLNPRSGEAHHGYAGHLAEVGRTREAVAEAMRARDVEPLSGTYGINVVWKLYLDRQFAQAELENQREGQRESNYTGGYVIASVFLQTGRPREAITELRKAALMWGRTAPELTLLANGLGMTGDRAEGRKVLRELQARTYVPPEYLAIVYEGLGDREQALRWFEKAYSERSMNGWFLPDPRLDGIRTEPRFKKIMRGMGLPL